MTTFDRFTRDRQSRFIWGGATVVFVALTLLATRYGRTALADETAQAQDRAVGYTQTVLFGALDADLLAEEIRGPQYRDLIIEVTGGIMTDEGVARVRIWSPDGTLLFSTESLEQIGTTAENRAPIDLGMQDQVSSQLSEATVAGKPGLAGTTEQLYQTFVPIHVRERTTVLGVAEIDRRYAAVVDAAEQPWRRLQAGLAGAALVCALLFLLSLRRPTSTIDLVQAPRSAAAEPVPDDENALRLRNELERERRANRQLSAELEAKRADGSTDPADGEAARLAAAESALAEAGAHAAELEAALARARGEAVAPEVLATLEERMVAAEARARDAEVRLQDLSASVDGDGDGHRVPSDTDAEPPADAEPVPAESLAEASTPAEPGGPSADAMDLRARLVRSAARKKLGSHIDDEPGA
jgi:hypothetical protein